MARVTVEDCIQKIPNRFELVLLAGHRARMIREGSPLTVDRDNDKDPVVSLREIAESSIDLKVVKEALMSGLQDIRPGEENERDDRGLGGGDNRRQLGRPRRAPEQCRQHRCSDTGDR